MEFGREIKFHCLYRVVQTCIDLQICNVVLPFKNLVQVHSTYLFIIGTLENAIYIIPSNVQNGTSTQNTIALEMGR